MDSSCFETMACFSARYPAAVTGFVVSFKLVTVAGERINPRKGLMFP